MPEILEPPVMDYAAEEALPSQDFYQLLVLKALSGLTKGFLRLTLPGGKALAIGSPGADVRASMRVLNPAFFKKCVLYGDVGFGESYVDGDWDTEDIRDVIAWMILNIDDHPALSGSRKKFSTINWLHLFNRLSHLFRPNTYNGSRRNIQEHYDLSNEFFQLVLDPSMTYSSASFDADNETLEKAQERKYEKLCRKLKLSSSDYVLEIGSGWGGFALHAARRYGCRVRAITISRRQYDYVREKIKEARLENRIEICLEDYRELKGRYDKIVSIEMLEAVGHQFLRPYFQKCHDLLAPNGILGIQVITCPDGRYKKLRKGVDWIQKYIFPGSLLPSVAGINGAINATGDMILHDLEDLSMSYTRTLAGWRDNMNRNWDDILALGFDETFRRKWNYYFSYCEAAFAMRNIAVLQMVYTRPNNTRL